MWIIVFVFLNIHIFYQVTVWILAQVQVTGGFMAQFTQITIVFYLSLCLTLKIVWGFFVQDLFFSPPTYNSGGEWNFISGAF